MNSKTAAVLGLALTTAVLLPAASHAGEAVGGAAPAAAPRTPTGVRRLRDVEYGRVGERALHLDLYLPEAAAEEPVADRRGEAGKRVPLVLWVHGGAWVHGSKEGCPLRPLVPAGYAVASIGYRLATEAPFPAQLDDLRTAVRFLRANADRYGIDPDRVAATGASAGGHLVALLATAGEGDCPEGTPSCRVQAVVDFFGPSDLEDLAGFASRSGIVTPVDALLGGPLRENAEKAALASPVTHVSRDDPPFLIVHGDRDWLVPVRQSRRLAEALRGAGVETTLHVVRGKGHGFRDPESDALVASFLEKHLKAKAPSGAAGAEAAGAPNAPAPARGPAAPAREPAAPASR